MPRIYVEFNRMKQIGNNCKNVSSKVRNIKSDFQQTIRHLDWDVKYQSDINATANRLVRKLDQYEKVLENYQRFLNDAYDSYAKLDGEKKLDLSSLIIGRLVIDPDSLPILVPSPCPRPNFILTDKIKEILENVNKEKDTLTTLKTLLGVTDNDEAGVLKDLISYIEDFSQFFTGDKKGLTGASDWCSLTNSSVGIWKGTYDYFHEMYSGVETGFFGDVTNKNVKILGLSAGIMGLVGSYLSASSGIGKKQWESVVADYIDGSKNIISVIKSGYDLKHIKDAKSLLKIKSGPWNVLDVYAAIGEAGADSISQGLRSIEQYLKDGKWTVEDTGATGIDISMAGLHGISHSLTGGLDEIIFSAVDNMTGGNGTADMSYVEKAAEGYKILARNLGESIGNWCTNLTN